MRACLARRDDAYDVALSTIAMADQQQTQDATQAKQYKAVFVFGVVWVADQLGLFINEN